MSLPRSADTFAGLHLGLGQFALQRHFPVGAHAFPADAEAVRALNDAVYEALREVSLVGSAERAARIELTKRAMAAEPGVIEQRLRAAALVAVSICEETEE